MNKKILLNKDQYYLDNFLPSLNKVGVSMLGYKHVMESILNFSSNRRGKSYGKRNISTPKLPVSKETITKFKVRTKGVTNCVYDKFHNLIEEFSTIKSATKYASLSPTSVSILQKKPLKR